MNYNLKMDLRKHRYGPNSYLKASQSRDYLRNQPGPHNEHSSGSFGAQGYDSFTGKPSYKQTSPPTHHSPLRSSSLEEAR